MMWQIFLLMLLVCSVFTSLIVEGLKNMLDKQGKQLASSNITVAVVAVVLALAISVGYALYFGLAFTIQYIICIVALCVLSWLCSMVGYDKVMQALSQLFGKKGA